MTIRHSIRKVPHHHSNLEGRFYGKTDGGTDFALRYFAGTTNERAIDMMQRRIEAATEARRSNRPLGIYSGPTDKEVARDERVDVLTEAAGQKFVIRIDVAGPKSYKVDGRYAGSLKEAVEDVMDRFEAKYGCANASAAEQAVSSMRF